MHLLERRDRLRVELVARDVRLAEQHADLDRDRDVEVVDVDRVRREQLDDLAEVAGLATRRARAGSATVAASVIARLAVARA